MEKLWLRSYPPGVPAEIGSEPLPTLVELMEDACRRHADKVAYVSMGRMLSYRELAARSLEFAAWLQSLGLARGSRVALMMPNLLQYPVTLFGTLRAGCVVVNCNPLYTPRELAYQLRDSGAEVVVVVENFAHTLEQAIAGTAVRHVVVTSMGEMLGFGRGQLVDFVVKRVKKLVPPWKLPAALNLATALAAGRRHGLRAVSVERDDPAFLQYTGGTTGVAKGAVLTHANLAANVRQAHLWIRPVVEDGRECILTALPLYHVFALTANCLVFLMAGARNVLVANPRDIPGLLREIARHRVSILTGVNTLFNALLNHPGFAALDFSHLKVTLGGGMAVQQAVAERWARVTGRPLLEAYGLTETSPAVTVNPLDLAQFNGSIGLPLPSTELSIRDDAGREVARGQIGEICVRGPQVMAGYWRRPDETALAFHADGFLRTGDLGYVDQLGFVFLVDRKKDIILVSGFNVYPGEVEEIAALHPGVGDVAAIGVPDDHCGEVVKLFVVRKDSALTAEALLEHCRAQLTHYKLPRQIEFRAELPRTHVGKILRRALKEEEALRGAAQVARAAGT